MDVVSLTEDHFDSDVGVGPHPELPKSDTAVGSTQEYTIISHDDPFLDNDNSDDDVADMKEFNEDELEHYGFQSDDDIDADWQDTYTHDDQSSAVEPSLVITDATTTAAAVFVSPCPNMRAFSRDEMTQRCKDVFGVEPKDEQLQVTEHVSQGKDCILIAGCGLGGNHRLLSSIGSLGGSDDSSHFTLEGSDAGSTREAGGYQHYVYSSQQQPERTQEHSSTTCKRKIQSSVLDSRVHFQI
jgi:hypothetical protein